VAGHYPQLPRSKAAVIRNLLGRKRARDDEQAFIIEGTRPILELARNQSPAVISIVLSSGFLSRQPPDIAAMLRLCHVPVYEVSDRFFTDLSQLDSAQGILALVRKPTWSEGAVLQQPHVLGLFGERLQDPTNLGTLVRLSAALDVSALWLTYDSADVFSPKIVRATAGAVLALPIFYCRDVRELSECQCPIYAATVSERNSIPLRHIKSIPPRMLVALGNETRGLSRQTNEWAALRFRIPLKRNVESLNVASAAAIAVFHFSGLPREASGWHSPGTHEPSP
jgi:TrmH family RNA methyltransferase